MFVLSDFPNKIYYDLRPTKAASSLYVFDFLPSKGLKQLIINIK